MTQHSTPAMVWIKGGKMQLGKGGKTFTAGVPDFWMGKYPVTNAEFVPFLDAKGNPAEGGSTWVNLEGSYKGVECGIRATEQGFEVKKGLEKHPMVYVSWYGARAYCAWLRETTGESYQLPSETQWEYAARGGQGSKGFKYAGSHNLKEVGWYRVNSHGETKPVGLKKGNELGLHDMSGNVWEWCADVWQEDIATIPKDGSATVEGNDGLRVVCGGSWVNDGYVCAVSGRDWDYADDWYNFTGVRVSRY